jgi:hypothetical protein
MGIQHQLSNHTIKTRIKTCDPLCREDPPDYQIIPSKQGLRLMAGDGSAVVAAIKSYHQNKD